jgi:hypothetical protein
MAQLASGMRSKLRKRIRQTGCYAILTFQKTGDTNWTTSLTDFRKTVG